MSSLFKTKGQAITDPGAMEAWKTAQPFHQQALGGLSNLANQVSANPAFSGQRVADLNPFQTASANNLGNFANQSFGFGAGMMNMGAQAGMPAAAVGNNAADIFSRASMDPTQMIINQAGQFANNPYTDGMIDAASRDVMRQFGEQTMPGMNRTFAGTGNTNSTRAGVESAIAQRGTADRLADISTGIRGQFFGRGLDMAQNQFNNNLSNMMNANSNLMNAGTFGAGLINAGQNFAGNNFNQGMSAGGVFQNQNQNIIQGNMDQFNESIRNPLSVYGALSGAAGNTQAKTSAGVVTQPSIASQVGSFVGALKPSDIRMKENIEKISVLPSGLSLYAYDYKPEFKDEAGHGRHIGVMAQEALEVFPEAVIVADNGYYAVDYSKIH